MTVVELAMAEDKIEEVESEPLIIRPAEEHELDVALRMIIRFVEESEYKDVGKVHAQTFYHTLEQMVWQEDQVLFYADRGGQIVGLIAMVVYRHPIFSTLEAMELAWWVEPEHRHGHAGRKLYAAAEAWSKDKRAVAISMLAPNTKIEELYMKWGFRKLETVYRKFL